MDNFCKWFTKFDRLSINKNLLLYLMAKRNKQNKFSKIWSHTIWLEEQEIENLHVPKCIGTVFFKYITIKH